MAEKRETLWAKLKRKVFQRHRLMLPPIRKKRRDDDEDEKTKREAERLAEAVARKARSEDESFVRDLRHETPRVTEAKKEATELASKDTKVPLKQEGPPLPTAGITNVKVLEILSLYNDRRASHIHENSESLKQLYTEILNTITDREQYDPANPAALAERDAIRANILDGPTGLRVHIVRYEQAERDRNRRASERQEKRYSYLTNVRVEPGNVRAGEPADEYDVIADRDTRNRTYSEIFANADAKPNQPFQQAFDVLTDGQKERAFLEDLRAAVQNAENIEDEAVFRHFANRTPGETIENARATLTDAQKNDERDRIQREVQEDLNRYQLERQVREVLHNANYVLELPNVKAEQLYDFIDPFGSNLVDFVQRTPGVRDMMNIYEMQLREAMAENDGHLRPEYVQRFVRTEVDATGKQRAVIRVPEVERRTKELFKKYVSGSAVYIRDDTHKGRVDTRQPGNPYKDWEVERLFTTARGMMVLSMRMLSLAAESKPSPDKSGTWGSLYLQDVIQNYAPFTHLLMKYHVPNDKALGVLFTEPDREKIFGVVRKPWMTKKLEHVKRVFESEGAQGARNILDGKLGEFLQIRRQNTGLCGDAYGFLSWRVGEDPDRTTGSVQLLKIGQKSMRIRAGVIGADPNIDAALSPAVQAVYNGLSATDRENYLKEYGSWVGTGLRFERLRDDMAFAQDKEKKKEAIDKGKRLIERIVDLQPGRIYLKSYKIQKRLDGAIDNLVATYGDTAVSPEQRKPDLMQKIQSNLLFLESKMYQLREPLLDNGLTFDGRVGTPISLVDHVLPQVGGPGFLPYPDAWAATDEFRVLVLEDFNRNKNSEGSWTREDGQRVYKTEQEGHFREFIEAREYNHGFTLWSGDAPVDEFNMSAVGPTGTFSRRARENKSIGEANVMITQLLTDTKYIRTPDEVFGHLTGIYAKIADWDASMAKEVVTWLSEGLLKFYGSTGPAKIPIIGGIMKSFPDEIRGLVTLPGHLPLIGKPIGKGIKAAVRGIGHIPVVGETLQTTLEDASLYITGSFAQRCFGKRAPVWHAAEMRYFIKNLMQDHGYINPQQAKLLEGRMGARFHDWFIDVADSVAPLLAVVILLWLIKEAAEEA